MELDSLNVKYETEDFKNGDDNFLVKLGSLPVILSAPHAVSQKREGIIKPADLKTGGIVEFISEEINCFGITRTCNLGDDPNFYNDGVSLKYKQEILRLINKYQIKLLLDIHGCSNKHGFDIEIGTNDFKNVKVRECVFIVEKYLATIGIVSVDRVFKSAKEATVSSYVHAKSGISCIQIEISNEIRMNAGKVKNFILVLEKAILEITERNLY